MSENDVLQTRNSKNYVLNGMLLLSVALGILVGLPAASSMMLVGGNLNFSIAVVVIFALIGAGVGGVIGGLIDKDRKESNVNFLP